MGVHAAHRVPSAFDGSLWTLHYEYICYLGIAVLAASTILRRAPKLILFLIAGCFCLILHDLITSPPWAVRRAGGGVLASGGAPGDAAQRSRPGELAPAPAVDPGHSRPGAHVRPRRREWAAKSNMVRPGLAPVVASREEASDARR
jgi:hypothetical protein